jgi:hypothetical protein
MTKLFHLDCTCGFMDSLGVPKGGSINAPSGYFYKWLKAPNGETYHVVELEHGTLITHRKHSSSRGCFDSYNYMTCKKCFKGEPKLTSTSSGW